MSFSTAAIILSAVGTGVSFIGGLQQASATKAIAAQNAIIQQQNARQEAAALTAQAEITRLQTNQNFQNELLETTQASRNADALHDRARVQEAIDAANLRRVREEGERLQAGQRAKFAAANIVDSTGSPLSILAETAGLIQKDLNERTYHNNLQAAGLYTEAATERLGGSLALAGATIDKNAGLASAGLHDASATATLLTGNRKAEITRLSGRAEATGLRYGALGNLLSGGAKTASYLSDL